MSDSQPVSKLSRRKIAIYIVNVILIICITGAVVWGLLTYKNLDRNLYTNDAQIEEYINPVNTRIPGYIKEVRFNEHQPVKKGDTLVIIDNNEYLIQLEQAEAAWLSATASRSVNRSSVNTVHSILGVADANIRAAEARVWNAQQNFRRYENLLQEGAATQQQFDQVKTEYDALLAQRESLSQQRRTSGLSTTEASQKLQVNDAEIKRTHAAVSMAKLNLSYTIIMAPYDGVTGRRTIQEGQLLQAGQTLLSFVRSDTKWVIANYKETQATHLQIGQRMILKVDGLDGKTFSGEVTALSQATGSRYSSIPVDNSSGNFVKVQQRIPVRIEFVKGNNSRQELEKLRAGMNVEVQLAPEQ